MGDLPEKTHDWAREVDAPHLDRVRRDPALFAPGGTAHLVLEVLASAAEEASATGAGRAVVTLHPDGSVSVADDGRGTETRVDGRGRAVRKPIMATEDLRFSGAREVVLLPDGHPRRGMSVVAALSRWLVHVNRRREGAWSQRYEGGVPVTDLVPVPGDGTSGTTVHFLAVPGLAGVSAQEVRRLAAAFGPRLSVEVEESAVEGPDPALATYEHIARHYDKLTGHGDTAGLVARYAEGLAGLEVPDGPLLDAGCGTGRSSALLQEHGYRVTGYDLSPAMVALARGNPAAAGVEFLVGDLRAPDAGLTGFGAVAFVDMPLAYLTGEGDLAAALAGARRCLAEGGVVAFDLLTEGFYREVYARTEVADLGDRYLARFAEPRGFAPDGVFTAQFDLFERDGDAWSRLSSTHVLRHHSDAAVRRALADAGLRLESVHGLVGMALAGGADEQGHERLLYLAGV